VEILNHIQIEEFINIGYIKIEDAFPVKIAGECRNILWKDCGCNFDDPATWIKPVIRLGDYSQEPFRKAVNTSLLYSAFNDLVGKERWLPRNSLGSFPIRFPNNDAPGDTGWHVDGSFPGDDINNFSTYRINVTSRNRALLMLFIFSDVDEHDAPTRIREGSHLDMARILAPEGEKGLSFMQLAGKLDATATRREVLATGKAGTVYLCHPFLVHAAQRHHGKNPRFMAQPPLFPSTEFNLQRSDGNYSPVEIAIRKGIPPADTCH
jgi:hypothetical protein